MTEKEERQNAVLWFMNLKTAFKDTEYDRYLDLAIEALKDFISKGIGENNDIHRIQRIVAEYFQISVDDIKSKKRSANIAFPRHIAIYFLQRYNLLLNYPNFRVLFFLNY